MNSPSYVRSWFRAVACLALLAAPASWAKLPWTKEKVLPPPVQAQVLDHAELLCTNCFFGPSDYYYCFAADSKILIGYQRTPVLNWRDDTKNYLTRVHKKWLPWAAPGDMLSLSYDDKNIWVTRPDGKQVQMIQNYSLDVFMNNDRCRGAVKPKNP